MFDFVAKQLLSLVISLAMIHVPQEKWLRKMENQPTQAERIAKKDLKGWNFATVVSERTGQLHSYYEYPCTDTSSRKTLLLLHGFNTDGAIFFNLAPLAATHRLIAYNFPEKTGLYTGNMRDFALVIDDFCEVMHLDTIDLLGNSLGGIIAQFHTVHTGRVTVGNLILVSTFVHGATKKNVRQMRSMADKLLPYPDYKLFYLLSLGIRISDNFDRGKGDDSPLATVVLKQIPWYREVLKAMYDHDGTGDAKKITCPVLVLHGKKDRQVSVAEVKVTEEYLTQATVRIFDNAGHTLIFSQADEAIKEIAQLINR